MTESTTNEQFIAVEFDPFAGPDILSLAPATESQTEIWTSCQLGTDDANRAYNESFSLRLTGLLQREAFDKAFGELVRRHEGLRTAFSADGLQMVVFQDVSVPVDWIDCSGRPGPEREECVREYARQDAQHLFDLTYGPLIKATLIRLSDTVHHFTLTAHHIVCDGWSVGVILQDLSILYSAYAQNRTPSMAAAPSLLTYALEEQAYMASAEYREIEQFWLNQYQDSVPVLDLPTDFTRPRIRSYAGNRLDLPLADSLVRGIKGVGIKAGCSFVTTLMAAFEVLLHRLTDQTDIVLGLPAAGQSATGVAGLVGHCVNLLPLRSQPAGDKTFLSFLGERKMGLLDALEHQRLTFGRLLKKLPIKRDISRLPLVPVVFNVDIGLDNGVAFYGLEYQLISNPRAFETFELSLNASGSEQKLVLEWSYNTQLFKAETIRTIHEQFEQLLTHIIDSPTVRLGDIPVGRSQPVHQPDMPWNNTRVDFPAEKSLHVLFSETARKFPDNTAVRFGSGTLTYQALNEKASQFAYLLMEQGVKPGQRIGMAVERSLELLVTMMAILKTGAAYVPLDPLHPTERLEFILDDSDCQILVVSRSQQGRFKSPQREVVIETVWPTLTDYPTTDPPVPSSGNDLMYVLYTSGTTGRPKGVQTKQNGVVNVLLSVQKKPGLLPADKTLALATVTFDLATVEIYTPLLAGAELILVDNATSRNGEQLADLIVTQEVTFIQATPATLRMLWEAGWRGSKKLVVISCAEALPMDLAQKLMESCHSLWNFYGPTETTIYATGIQIFPTDESITIGRPIDNTQVYILDEQLRALPPGKAGEIGIAGAGLAKGYLNQAQLTAEKFIDFPLADGASVRLYRTGDLGRFDASGAIHYLGRIDQQVKIRGHRIEVAEIEHHLLKQAGVKNAVVIAREDTPGDQRLVAYIVPGQYISDQEAQIGLWRQGIRQMLPDYMLPNNFVLLEALPVTSNGKIDKKALPKPGTRVQTQQPTAHPQTKAEQVLASIWIDVFDLDTIDIDENFFDIGGHSLNAVQVMTRLEKVTGRRLPLSTLFEFPTIRKLAQLVEESQKPATSKSLVPIKPEGGKVPVYIIHGIGLNLLNFSGLVAHTDPDQPIYGLQAKGLDGTEEPLDKMEAIAAHYIAEILDHNPTGPYAIAGYSFGGYVAYEMAQQLTAMGKDIKMLAMFDTDARALINHHTTMGRVIWKIGRQLPKLVWIGQSLIKRPLTTISYQWSVLCTRMNALLRKAGVDRESGTEDEPAHLVYLMEKHETAFQNYVLRPYTGTIDLFRATSRLYFVDDFHYLGWKDYAGGGVRVHDVAGDHATMLLPPNDVVFARVLQRALDNA